MRTVILGGGISGLSAAWFIHQKDPSEEIVLLEQKDRLGGWIETETKEGFCFEKGPRTVAYSRSPMLVQLIDRLGLREKMIFSSPVAKRRWLYKRGKLCSLSSFWPSLLGAAIRELWVPKRMNLEDESIYAFASRRFGHRIANGFFDPLTLGIYAGDIHCLSMRSCFPSLWRMEAEAGSVVRGLYKGKKGPSGLFTLQGGLQTIIEEIERQLLLKTVTNCQVEALSYKPSMGSANYEIITSQGVFQADRVISALPAPEISRLTGIALDVPYRSLWVVHIGFLSKPLRYKGFGYLVPTEENEQLLGMVWDSEIFSSESQTRLTCMFREEVSYPVDEALNALKRHLSIREQPDYVSCHCAFRAIPQFELGHEEKIAHFEKEVVSRFPFLLLTGNYLAGASLESCVARSFVIVDRGI